MFQTMRPVSLGVQLTLLASGKEPEDFKLTESYIDMGWETPDKQLLELHGSIGPTHWIRVAVKGLKRHKMKTDFLFDCNKKQEVLLIHPEGEDIRQHLFVIREYVITTGLYDRFDYKVPCYVDAIFLYLGPESVKTDIYPLNDVPIEVKNALAVQRRPTYSPRSLRRKLIDLKILDNELEEEEILVKNQKKLNITNPDIFNALTLVAQVEEVKRDRKQNERLLEIEHERLKIKHRIANIINVLKRLS